ncbi:hypothetical protein BLNAU_14919 [Blattamonas nauphoetae]|uniref:Uncharacterized protein n=1 Tax=Blattamonas nauphoetae TaxID=2049346 RepID=A0ABQ9XFK2_9EUKA|nr:hypothetical protein BLNAU_14919 [Blattamonas nauphoetae]
MSRSCPRDLKTLPRNYVSLMLEEFFDPVLALIVRHRERNEKGVEKAIVQCLVTMVQSSGSSCRNFISAKMKSILETMEQNQNQADEIVISELEVMTAMTLRIEQLVQPYQPHLLPIHTRLAQNKNVEVIKAHLQFLYVLGCHANPARPEFFTRMTPFLKTCLDPLCPIEVQSSALEVVPMYAMLYLVRFAPYLPHFVPLIGTLFSFHQSQFSQTYAVSTGEILLSALNAISDIAISPPFIRSEYIDVALSMIQKSLRLEIPSSSSAEQGKVLVSIYDAALNLGRTLIEAAGRIREEESRDIVKAKLEMDFIQKLGETLSAMSAQILYRCADADMAVHPLSKAVARFVGEDFTQSLITFLQLALDRFPLSAEALNLKGEENELSRLLRTLQPEIGQPWAGRVTALLTRQ